MEEPLLRPGVPGEEKRLSDLCLRSKAYWGYDLDFLEACRGPLSIGTAGLMAGHVTVCEARDKMLLGVCEVSPGSEYGNLEKLFIDPDAIGRGIGRILFETAKAQLKALGEKKMTILSDPFAEPVYVHWGARRVRMKPSEVFEGRELPWMEMEL